MNFNVLDKIVTDKVEVIEDIDAVKVWEPGSIPYTEKVFVPVVEMTEVSPPNSLVEVKEIVVDVVHAAPV